MRDLEARLRAIDTGLRGAKDLLQKADELAGGLGIFGADFGTIWGWSGSGWDIYGNWPIWWIPPFGWDGEPEEFPGGGWSDDDTSGPWGDEAPANGTGVRLSKYMHDPDTGAYLAYVPVTVSDETTSATVPTSDAGVHGRAVFYVRQGQTYTVSWPAMNGYPSGSEEVTISANAGGVHKKINEVSKDPDNGGTGWPAEWVPPTAWSGVDEFPANSWSDSDTEGPWGTGTPPDGQAVRLSKYMQDFATSDPLKFMTVTVAGPGGSFTLQTDSDGRLAFRVRQGGTYTVSWPAMNGYPSGSEAVTIAANAGGVHVKTNRVTANSEWPSEWKPPSGWAGQDVFPSGTWTDDDTSGPWGTDPPPAGQVVRISKYMQDQDTSSYLGGVPITVTGSGGTATASTASSGVVGRAAFRVSQGKTYTISWDAHGGYPAGSESVTIAANAGGVHKMTNQVTAQESRTVSASVFLNSNGTPLVGLSVEFTGIGTYTTDADGNVTSSPAVVGTTYKIHVTGTDQFNTSRDFWVGGGTGSTYTVNSNPSLNHHFIGIP